MLEAGLTEAIGDGARPQDGLGRATTRKPGAETTKDALAAGADPIIVAGGDGTVRAAAEHLADVSAEAQLGIIPLGTGNLLARNLGADQRPAGGLRAGAGR